MSEYIDFSTPITSDMTIYTKMATLDVLTFSAESGTLPGQEQETTLYIAQITSFDKEEIVVPLTHDGNVVNTLLGAQNENGNDNTTLEHIYLSKDIFYLAGYFNNLTALKTINLENIQILYGIFANCISLTEVNLQNIQVIRNNAFSGCENLDIDFSTLTNLQSIGENAFAMSGVTEFNPPSSLVYIGSDAFAGSQLETIFWDGQLNVNPIIKC